MSWHYSNPDRENDKWSLPDLEVFELTALEAAAQNEDMIYEYTKRHEFRLALMDSRVRKAMFDAMIEENGLTGGWFYCYCLPGCMPDSEAFGPYTSRDEALKAARDESEDIYET